MSRMIARKARVFRDLSATTLEFTGAAGRKCEVVISPQYEKTLMKSLTDALSAPLPPPATILGSPPQRSAYDVEFRPYDDGKFGFAWIGPNGEIEALTDLADAEALLDKLAKAVAAAKQGRHQTRQ